MLKLEKRQQIRSKKRERERKVCMESVQTGRKLCCLCGKNTKTEAENGLV